MNKQKKDEDTTYSQQVWRTKDAQTNSFTSCHNYIGYLGVESPLFGNFFKIILNKVI